MISYTKFELFDPLNSQREMLPDIPGNSVIVLRQGSSLPNNVEPSLPQMTFFYYQGEEYKVIYVGKSSKSLRTRDYNQHFKGTAGNSTLRKSIGCLLGYQLIPRDANAPLNGKTKFNEDDEKALSKWMENNLLVFFYANAEYVSLDKELIKVYNPPLNLQGNFNEVNSEFRKRLSSLRNQSLPDTDMLNNSTPSVDTAKAIPVCCCPVCGNRIKIRGSLELHRKLTCSSCGNVFRNPYYKPYDLIMYAVIAAVIIFAGYFLLQPDSSQYIGDKQELTYSEAKVGVKFFLKHNYLKDPDSYEAIEWIAFGTYNKENDTYFALHKYRAKNSFGGYVVEEKVFVLDKDGNVLKMVDDMNEIINDY